MGAKKLSPVNFLWKLFCTIHVNECLNIVFWYMSKHYFAAIFAKMSVAHTFIADFCIPDGEIVQSIWKPCNGPV